MRKCFPFYLNILTAFSLLLSAIVTGVVVYSYHGNSASALVSARQMLVRVGSSVTERSRTIFDTAFNATNLYINSPGITEKPSIHSHPMSQVFFRFLEQNPDFTSIYIGFDDGDFFLASTLSGRDALKNRLNIPPEAVWYTQTIGHLPDGTRYELKKYMDAGFVTVGSSGSRQVEYDPRKRGWFKEANRTNVATLSDVYVFSLSGEPGITVSRLFEGKVPGVFGVDISLSNLSRFVLRQSVGDRSEIMIFGSRGNVFAYSDLKRLVEGIREHTDRKITEVEALGVPVLTRLMADHQARGGHRIEAGELSVSGEKYLVHVNPLPTECGKELFVAVAVPKAEFTGPIVVIGEKIMLVSLGLLLLSLPLIYMVAKIIGRPLTLLKNYVENIKAFNLDVPIVINTRVLEIQDLAAAMETMRGTLKAFGSYVPKPLVKGMITHDIIPTLGGDRRELTFLFTDIAGFTSLSETMTPEDLTGSITRYFKKISQVILSTNGTVDKYIGDAVMAFWNAPVRNADHAHDACLAALRCRAALKVFNRRKRERGRTGFSTRMGIHTGEAVVGNIGSTDRMAYTVVGASVNFASRLDGLNKYLGTDILVSGATMRVAGDRFVFRFAGRVIPKGTSSGVKVYQLLGTRLDSPGVYAPLTVDQGSEARVAEWETAFGILLARDFAGAAKAFSAYIAAHGPDGLAEHYLAVAEAFMVRPPAADWKGEQVFDAK